MLLIHKDSEENQEVSLQAEKKSFSIFYWIIAVFIILGIYNSIENKSLETPKDINNIGCVAYKGLCIANYDIKYTPVRDNTNYYNGWLGANTACKDWGGRLPYKNELVLLKEAFSSGIINRSKNTLFYLSSTPYGFEQAYALSMADLTYNSSITTVNQHLKPVITPVGPVEQSLDKYDYAARCIKNIDN